jgi:photosystem II stability/assembly factor-like uncharacterized protein
MESGSTASGLTARKRRAVGLIAISLLALALAGLTWIAPSVHLGEQAKPKPITARHFSPTPSLPTVYPTMYDFASMSVGWAVVAVPVETKVFKTVDGGRHWRLLSRLGGSYSATIQFVDTTHGFVVTARPHRLYRTTDGGAHWALAAMPAETDNGIVFTDTLNGSAWVPPVFPNYWTLYTTEDGGDTWRRLPDLPRGAVEPVFRGPEAWLSVYASQPGKFYVYASVDRGLAWSPVELALPAGIQPATAAPQFFNAQVNLMPGAGVAVSVLFGAECGKGSACARPDQAQFVSFDRGGTWARVSALPGAFSFHDIAYQDVTHWWALGAGSLFKTSDAGQTWQQVNSMAPSGQSVLHVVDAQHAWAQLTTFVQTNDGVIHLSAVVVTNDGGLSWSRVPQPQLP